MKIMSIIKQTNEGHKFIIDGYVAPDNIINITVIPLDGYEFVSWLSNTHNITEIDKDDDNNRRFSYYIDECGVTLSALFQVRSFDPLSQYYFETLILEDIPKYVTNHLTYDTVTYIGDDNFQINNLNALTFFAIPNTVNNITVSHQLDNGFMYTPQLKKGLPKSMNTLETSFIDNGFHVYSIITGNGEDLGGNLIITIN